MRHPCSQTAFHSLLCVALGAACAEDAVPRPDSAKQIEYQPARRGKPVGKPITFTVYREMSYRGLTVRIFPGTSENWEDNAFLRKSTKGAYQFINRGYTLAAVGEHDFVCVPELDGQPAIVTNLEKYEPYTIRFSLSKPARVYAYIRWTWTNHPNRERDQWRFFRLDPKALTPVYYRDFAAGEHTLNFHADPFVGVGICPIDALAPAQKIIPIGSVEGGRPVLRVRSEHKSPQPLAIAYEVVNPSDESVADRGSMQMVAEPRAETSAKLGLKNLTEGVLYFVKVQVTGAGSEWGVTIPYGLFPVPPAEPSIEEPIIPYGGYVKLRVNDAPELYNRFLAATFYHFRKMHMNAAVLGIPKKHELDLAKQYGIKAVIRLGNTRGREHYAPKELVYHPAVLTYMVGDEPKIGEKLDAHITLFESLTQQYPEYKPITCTIYDGWGRGDEADPCRIYNEHLERFDLIRFGRFYCFQKLGYGLLHPISYKPRIGPTATFLGLEADPRPWWLGPQFFGVDKPKPVAYWRLPSGKEMKALLHLAMAHRCTGILGWGTHSHGRLIGLCFDGHTMAPSPGNAMKELAEFGAELQKAKDIVRRFTTARIQIHRRRPYEVDVAGRWLKGGRVAIYVVNRDLERNHPVEMWWFLGDRFKARNPRFPDPDAYFDEITGIANVFDGAAVPHEKVVVENDRIAYAKLTLANLPAGEAALIVVNGQGKDGRFRSEVLTPDLRKLVGDEAYAEVD